MQAGKVVFDAESEPCKQSSLPLSWHDLIYIIVLVKGLEGKKIVQIACGQQHSVALDDEGYVCTIHYHHILPHAIPGSYTSGAVMATVD